MTEIVQSVLKDFGPWAAMSLLLLWWINRQIIKSDVANEKAVKRLQTSEDWIRGTLTEMNTKMIEALADNSFAMREMVQSNRDTQRTNREILAALRSRPCMHEAELPDAPTQPPTEPLVRRKDRDHA